VVDSSNAYYQDMSEPLPPVLVKQPEVTGA
jgi:hypothetical protein